MHNNREFTTEIKYSQDQTHYQEFLKVKSYLMRNYPNSIVQGVTDDEGSGAFEVYAGGRLIHSKKNGDGFLDNHNFQEFMQKLQQATE